MPSISSPGVGSGLDVSSIVSSLMAVERRPLNLLQSEASKITTKVSAWGRIQSDLSSLQDAARALLNSTTFSAAKASSADESKIKVSSNSGATTGNYDIVVNQLAQKQTLTSAQFAASTDVVGDGSLTITLGSAGVGGFVADSARTPVSIAIPAGSTLTQVRDAINGASAGVKASVITDVNGARLSLRSVDSGANQAFEVSATDSDGNNTDAAGLSRLSYSTAGVSPMTRSQTASNAELVIDGIPITSASNTVSGAVEAVTFELLATSSTPVGISVSNDADTMKKSVQDFVDAYNKVNTTLSEQVKYDATTKRGGPLQGDRSATQVQSQLRELLRATVGSGTLTRLSEGGIELQRDGSLKVNDTKLSALLATPENVKKLFQHTDSLAPASAGLARQIDAKLTSWLGADGTVTGASSTLSKRSKAIQLQQEAVNRRLENVQKQLLKTYTALDQQLTQIRSTPIPSASSTSS